MIEINGKRMRRMGCVYTAQTKGWGIGRGAEKKGYREGKRGRREEQRICR